MGILSIVYEKNILKVKKTCRKAGYAIFFGIF
jgi:hypothetical protein